MTRTNELRELIAYTRWANELILDAAAALSADEMVRDLGSSFPSVRDTLLHMMSAEWVWLSRLGGTSPDGMPAAWRSYDRGRLREEWKRIADRIDGACADLDDAGLDRVVDYRTTSGQPFKSTVGQILRHLANHTTYHRGQVTTMLRQLGARAPATDLIHYYRTRPAARRLEGPVVG